MSPYYYSETFQKSLYFVLSVKVQESENTEIRGLSNYAQNITTTCYIHRECGSYLFLIIIDGLVSLEPLLHVGIFPTDSDRYEVLNVAYSDFNYQKEHVGLSQASCTVQAVGTPWRPLRIVARHEKPYRDHARRLGYRQEGAL